MRNVVNTTLTFLKWPVAVLMVLLLLPTCWALLRLLWRMVQQPQAWLPLWLGLLAFALLWLLWLRRAKTGNWLYTLEHELTHALFAIITFNKVTDLNAKQGTGYLAYEGSGSWLVSLAPYFFPTFCVLPLLALQFAVPAALPWLLGLLGFALGMQVHGTLIETHRHQPDLMRHGRLASWCIVPGAMALTLLILLAALPGNARLALNLFRDTLSRCWDAVLSAHDWALVFRDGLGL